MIKESDKTLGFLGIPYQKRLISQIISDYDFANNIIDIISPNYFTNEVLVIIMSEIKNAFEINDVIPDIDSLEARLYGRNSNETTKLFIKTQLEEIKSLTKNDYEYIQETAIKFCRQQELKKSLKAMQDIVDKGDLNDYDNCEDILKKALEVGQRKDDSIDVFYDLDSVLSEDFRNPIPTGIDGLDAKMNGGLSKGELGLILAPFGVGKTTLITKIANTAFNIGLNVVQIIFEDMPKVIQRKHISCWTKLKLNDLGLKENRPYINKILDEKNKSGGVLKIRKFPSDGTTMPMIRQYIRKLVATGDRPDVVLLDYIDCITPVKKYDNEWGGEGPIMRKFETLLNEFKIAGWTALQGTRGSISADIVDSSMIGGSIKKGQIGHFIVSIAKTLEQKENGRANMAILKSRFGIDGITFNDILFDNSTIQISINENSGKTESEMEAKKLIDHNEHMKNIMKNIDKDLLQNN